MYKTKHICKVWLIAAVLLPITLYAQQPDAELTDTLAGAKIVTDKLGERNSTQTGLKHLDKEHLYRSFALLSTPDVIKTLQNMSGVASGTEIMSGLYVHGGDGTDNLFLLDGVPMYQVSHFAGLFSSFNMDVIESLDFYKSGFPGRYGGRLSSVVDIRTETGDFQKYHGTFSIGLIDGRVQFGGPIIKDKLSFNVAIRSSWLDLLLIPGFAIRNKGRSDKTSVGYDFYDANANLTWLATSRSRFTARFYVGGDYLTLKESQAKEEYNAGKVYRGEDKTSGKITWGNILGSLTWDTRFNDDMKLNAAVYYSNSYSKIRTEFNTWNWSKDTGEETGKLNQDNYSDVGNLGTTVNLIYSPHKNHILRLGAKYAWTMFYPRSSYLFQKSSINIQEKKLVKYSSHDISIYAEDEMTIARWLKINAGIRYSAVCVQRKIWHLIEPRAAMHFICSDFLSIKASYVDMNQPDHLISATYFDLPTNCWMPSTRKTRPSHSRQFAGGIYTHFPYNIEFNIEGYYRTLDHILEYCGENGLFPSFANWENDFKEGKGRSYGIETEFSWRSDKVDVSAYYTLSWSERFFPSIYAYWYPARNDNRHKLTLAGNYRVSKKIDIYAAWNYHSGSWVTGADYFVEEENHKTEFFGRPNNVQMPDYHRLDVGMNIHKTTKRGNESIWNISIYNVYCRMNAINAHLEKDKNGIYHGVAQGLVPIIPTFSYTLKF